MKIAIKKNVGLTYLILLGILLLLESCNTKSKAEISKPNFIIIYTDDLGYGDLSCMGAKNINTPNIDQMALEGISFMDFYSGSASCTPARAALMTGSYPKRVMMDNVLFPGSIDKHTKEVKGLNPSEITIAEVLKTKGYSTGIVGKWHLGDDSTFMPNNQGFDYFFGLPYSNDMLPPNFVDLPLMRNSEVVELNPDQDYITKRYTEESIAFIEKNKDEPFFLYLAHSMPHRACHASPEFTKRFSEEEMQQIQPGEDKKSRDFLYPAAVEEIDWSTGEILRKLRELGLEENTLVVFTSDNGPMTGSAGPLRGKKGSVFEGGHRVPCIMQWKGRIPEKKVSRELTTAMDFLPTFAGLAGAEMPRDRVIDGQDILPLLEAKPNSKSPHETFFYTHDGMAVRSGKWKLILRVGKQNEIKKIDALESGMLFDLEADIAEKNNLIKEYPKVAQRLESLFNEFLVSLKTTSRPAGSLIDK